MSIAIDLSCQIGGVGVGENKLHIVFDGAAPDANNIQQLQVLGTGTPTDTHTATIYAQDADGVYRGYEANKPIWQDGRVDLDPAKLFATFTTTATTPSPITNFYATFNDGSTHREKYTESGGDVYIGANIASGVTASYRPGDGAEIAVYLGNLAALTNFRCNSNQLTGSIPDLSANTALTDFRCNSNQLTGSIPDLSSNTALLYFWCYSNQLTGSIPDLSANTALTQFLCNSNQLTGSIPDLSANTALTNFYCYTNQLTGSIPDLSANTALTQFLCSSNQLTGSIPDLSANTALTNFYCYRNQLTGSIPDLSANTALTNFYCYTNQLTGSIPDLSSNTALTDFYCNSNQLTGSIPDLSSNTALIQFLCNSNQLTGFSGGWPNKAFNFDASNNALTEAAVNQILVDADTYGIATGTTIDLSGGTNAAPTGAGATAKANLIANGATVTTN